MKFQYLILSLLVFLIFACNNTNSTDESTMNDSIEDETTNLSQNEINISPDGYATGRDILRIENVSVPKQSFKVDAAKGKTIEIKETGTSIVIPENAFVDATGNPVNGEVKIEFEEYHDVGDIIASGIPMQMTAPDGSTGYMQSAGMFDIQGSAGGKAIFIAEGKSVEVNLASKYNDTEYDFWSFDKKNKQWLNKGVSKAKDNVNKIKAKKYIAKNKSVKSPVKPYQFDKNKAVMEFDINLENFPELKEMNGVVWQYAGNDSKKDPLQNKWVFSNQWDSAEIEPFEDSNLFRLKLKSKNKEFITTVCPSQSGAEFQASMAEYSRKQKEYESNKVTIAEMKELAKNQADFIRSYSVEGFGIYNYDVMMKDEDNIPILADFDFGTMIPGIKKIAKVYMITGDRNVVVYPYSDWHKIRINPNTSTKMVAILPGNKYATINEKQFATLMDDIKASENRKYIFKMNFKDEVIASLDHLKKIIKSLS